MVHHRQFPHYPEHVPDELKEGPFWVCCDEEKIPLVVWETYRAKSTDPRTWRHYDEAVAAWQAHPERYAGVGRVITEGDPYVGVDLDKVIDAGTRELSSGATAILTSLDSYSEVSPSGTGVKVWVRARLDRSYRKTGIEVYQRGRYFTITGQLLPQLPPTIEPRSEEIFSLVEREFAGQSSPSEAGPSAKPYDGPKVALVEYLDGVEVHYEVPDGLGVKFRIRCPWIDEHTAGADTGTYIGQREDGGPWFHCWHSHCAARGWPEFRQVVRPVRTLMVRIPKDNPAKLRRVRHHD